MGRLTHWNLGYSRTVYSIEAGTDQVCAVHGTLSVTARLAARSYERAIPCI
jgi:hypothetical protein